MPIKFFMLMMIGILNFLVTNFHRRISKFSREGPSDTFYIVSETFSFICISYMYEYLYTQANNISHLMSEKDNKSSQFYDRIASATTGYKEHSRNFSFSEDSLWLSVFLLIFLCSNVGISQGKYLVFLFSLQYFKIAFKIFSSIFKYKVIRIILIPSLFFILIVNHVISSKNDRFLFEALGIVNTSLITFCKFVTRLGGLVFVLLIIISNFEFVAVLDDKTGRDNRNIEQVLKKLQVSATYEKKKKKLKSIEIHVGGQEKTPFSFMNFIYDNCDIIMNYFLVCLVILFIKEVEKNYFIIIFYSLLLAILFIRVRIFI